MSMSLFSTKYNLRKWDIPIQDDPSRFGIIRNAAHVINLLLEAKESQETYTYLLGDTDSGRTGGFSYMPPPLTDDYFPSDDPRVIGQLRTQGYVPPDYDPSADPALLRYCQVMSLLANYLDIGRDSAIEASTVGALLIPEIARTSWPSADALEQYEETLLLPYIEEKLTSLSTKGVERWLQDEHNYTFYEAYDLVLAAKNMSSEIHDHNPLNERTTTLNSLDRLREDCVTEGHITTELNAIKTKIAVLGLTPRESDSKLEESENYARELDDVINAKQLPGPEIEDDLDESL
ncbi:MAG: hypothetical protein GY845_25670 [Planctomycetes bacterium]|nr:hypothetical protein [Planctomycetota bacterium]